MKRIVAMYLSSLLLMANLLCLVAPGSAYAQALIELRGTVIDETNAYIAAAPLTLEDAQGVKHTAVADDHGRYRFAVKPGIYTLTVEVEGFAKFIEQIDLTSKPSGAFDVKLKVMIAEQVEVKDNAAAISTDPDKNLSAITLTEKDLEALPDDPDELLETLKQMAGAAGADANVFVGGFRERGQLPPKEAILRININSNPFSAEHTETGFGRIEIITKPGVDTFHGGFNLNFNDESLNARNPYASFRAPLQTRNFGGYFSGPIVRNRAGFFFDFSRNEFDGNGVVNAIVLNPVTFQPEPFIETVLTPRRGFNFSVRSDVLLTKKHTIGVQYRHSENEAPIGGVG
ncbi:MAG TPA: carboxypeptidase regulatory-like domain-containing protein, partial [Blastocatellia bacterium]|nr:carboxypeptidase regulatory-like domain-containing protein [Blastocatellia bacterium]